MQVNLFVQKFELLKSYIWTEKSQISAKKSPIWTQKFKLKVSNSKLVLSWHFEFMNKFYWFVSVCKLKVLANTNCILCFTGQKIPFPNKISGFSYFYSFKTFPCHKVVNQLYISLVDNLLFYLTLLYNLYFEILSSSY